MFASLARCALTICLLLSLVPTTCWGQSESSKLAESSESSEPSAPLAQDQRGQRRSNLPDDLELRKEVEPGVVVYGKANRFAEVGESQQFDSSPDGRTLVFASSKLTFFDLIENKITDVVGGANQSYNQVLYSPDGRYVFATGYPRQLVEVFDAIDKSSVGTVSFKVESEEASRQVFYPQQMAVSADAKYIAISSHREVQVRKVANGELVYHQTQLGYSQGMAFSSDERELYIPQQGKLAVVDLKTGQLKEKSESELIGQSTQSLGINLARELLAIPQANSVTIFDLKKGQVLGAITMPQQAYPQAVFFSDDGTLLGIQTWKQTNNRSKMVVVVADVDQLKAHKTAPVAAQNITRARFSTDNKSLFIAGHGIPGVEEIVLADVDDETAETANPKYPIGPAQVGLIHPDGNSFVTSTQSGEITWIDTSNGNVLRKIKRVNPQMMELNRDGDELFVVARWGQTGPSRIKYETAETIKTYPLNQSKKNTIVTQIRSFMFSSSRKPAPRTQSHTLSSSLSPDESELNTLSMDVTYRQGLQTIAGGQVVNKMTQQIEFRFETSEAETGKRLYRREFSASSLGFSKNQWPLYSAVHPEGTLAAISNGNKVFLVATETGEAVDELSFGKFRQIRGLSFSPDGKFLAASSYERVLVWDSETGREIRNFEFKGSPMFDFSQDGKLLACCGQQKDSEVEVVDTSTWKTVFRRKRSEADRKCIALSQDGSSLLLGLSDCRFEIWDLAELGRSR